MRTATGPTDLPDDAMERSTALVQALQDPRCYPHPVASIALLETHLSWVLLTGDYAYKLKKPVTFDFVDFSALEQRKAACDRELTLNRRYAEELYLSVVPICLNGGPHLDGAGEAVEYAVKMVQFPADALLSTRLEQRKLTPEDVDNLAERIAAFHRSASSSIPEAEPGEEPYGSPAAIRREAMENVTVLSSHLSGELLEQMQALHDWTLATFEQLAPVFESRRASGCVRECHGDLHLGNLIWRHGAAMPFDGVEFNDRFRWIDLASDAAFVAMDLEDQGRGDLGRRFANLWVESLGDVGAVPVWTWYVVYRALVRAKVAALRQQQSGDSSSSPLVEEYLSLAERRTRRPRPTLTITHGLSGSGKTYESQRLLESTGAFRVRSDVERKRMLGLRPSEKTRSGAGEGAYTPERSAEVYDHLAGLARQILNAGESVIVDATFLHRRQREAFRAIAEQAGAGFQILACEAEEATLRARIAKRAQGPDASEATGAVLDLQLANCEPLSPEEREDVIAFPSGGE